MIRTDHDYNQIRLFIRYVIGRKSLLKLVHYIKDQLEFHNFMKMAVTPDGITFKVSLPGGDIFVPLGQIDEPICVVNLAIIGAAMFASSNSTYMKRIDLVKHLRLKDKKPLKPELEVIIPNMAPYIKRLNERLGYRAIISKKIGREAACSFETRNFRGNSLIPYHMEKRKFTCTWTRGDKILFFTHPDGPWHIINSLKENNIWSIPSYNEEEIKVFTKKYNPKVILFDNGRTGDTLDLFGYVKPVLKDSKIPCKYFSLKENGKIEICDEKEQFIFEEVSEFVKYLENLFKKNKS